ncbi:MAG: Triose-phosphate Transporter [Watsoniomyces obsoletus]|nr:MAG: Triose-phosphate Transporter [Watsoniomyces obsoletus]
MPSIGISLNRSTAWNCGNRKLVLSCYVRKLDEGKVEESKVNEVERGLALRKAAYFERLTEINHRRAEKWKERAQQLDESIGTRRAIGSAFADILVAAVESEGRENKQQTKFRANLVKAYQAANPNGGQVGVDNKILC